MAFPATDATCRPNARKKCAKSLQYAYATEPKRKIRGKSQDQRKITGRVPWAWTWTSSPMGTDLIVNSVFVLRFNFEIDSLANNNFLVEC